MYFIFSRKCCIKAFRRIIARSRSGKITRSRFVSYFRRTLDKKCGRKPTKPTKKPQRCSKRQLRTTIRTVTRSLTKVFCTYRKKYRYSATLFLKSYFRRYSYKGKYLRCGALSKTLSKKLPRGARKLRKQLRSLRWVHLLKL